MEEQIQRIIENIAKGKVIIAIENGLIMTKGKFKKLHKEILILSSRYNRIVNKERIGIYSSEFESEKNEITNSYLKIVQKLTIQKDEFSLLKKENNILKLKLNVSNTEVENLKKKLEECLNKNEVLNSLRRSKHYIEIMNVKKEIYDLKEKDFKTKEEYEDMKISKIIYIKATLPYFLNQLMDATTEQLTFFMKSLFPEEMVKYDSIKKLERPYKDIRYKELENLKSHKYENLVELRTERIKSKKIFYNKIPKNIFEVAKFKRKIALATLYDYLGIEYSSKISKMDEYKPSLREIKNSCDNYIYNNVHDPSELILISVFEVLEHQGLNNHLGYIFMDLRGLYGRDLNS